MKRPSLLPVLPGLLAAALLLSGCATTAVQPFRTERATPGTPSEQRDELLDLPAPNDQIVAAVYRFRDQTGQYKRKERGSTFSRAVTQGGTSILVDALEESDWFVPIERRGLSNLLNERDIIRSTRSQYEGSDAQQLSPLLFAGVMLEGGIIGYSTNVITGGGGVRLFGIGGSGEYRKDRVTVYLRAVSTRTGRVLASVDTKKTILSQKLDGDAFQFVESDLILETEVGISFNEPSYIAVKEAIDEAVKNLIVEGVQQDAWGTADTTAANLSDAMERYEQAKAKAARTDYFDRLTQPDQRQGFGVGLSGGGLKYQGDIESPQARGSGALALRYPLAPRWEVGLEGEYSELATAQVFRREAVSGTAYARYYALPRSAWTPYLQVDGGVNTRLANGLFDSGAPELGDASLIGGGDVGVQVMATQRLAVDASFGVTFSADDDLDDRNVGSFNDSLWGGQIGLTYYGIGALF